MMFPKEYLALNRNKFANNNTSLIPIRYEDRDLIMKWRNEQMYHLRQKSPLSRQNQKEYFKNIVSKLYNQKQPSQLLFSYLEDNELVGYGGLVHIDWESKKAEISFIMNTTLEEESFSFHWSNYLSLIEDVAFNEIGLKAIYTYAYDLRPHLYHTLEDNSFILKNRFTKEVLIFV